MKKSLIALAALASVAGVAQAQSSVSIYGVMDAGFSSVKGVNSADQSASGMASSLMSTSRLGFTGTEDLGGGNKAFFKLEAELIPTVGATSADGRTFKRDASLGLTGAAGTVKLGRYNTLGYDTLARFDAAGASNTGSTVAGVANSKALAATRVDSAVAYVSPTFAGFSVAGAYSTAAGTKYLTSAAGAAATDANGVATPGANNQNRAYNYELNYTAGAFAANVGYLEANASNTAAYKNTYYNASYNFGVAKVAAGHWENKLVSSGVKAKATTASVGAPVTANVTLGATYTDIKNASNTSGNDATMTSVNAVYSLSKRTSLYAIYAVTNNDASATVSGSLATAQTTLTGTTSGAGKDQKISAVGIKHTF